MRNEATCNLPASHQEAQRLKLPRFARGGQGWLRMSVEYPCPVGSGR